MARTDRFFGKAAILVLVAAAIGLSACGRKGPLQPPPSATAAGTAIADPAESGPPKPDRDFILDPLLD